MHARPKCAMEREQRKNRRKLPKIEILTVIYLQKRGEPDNRKIRKYTDYHQNLQPTMERRKANTLTNIMHRRPSGYSLLRIAPLCLLSILLTTVIFQKVPIDTVAQDYVSIGNYDAGERGEKRGSINEENIAGTKKGQRGLCFDYTAVPHDYMLHHSSYLPSPDEGSSKCHQDSFIENIREALDRSQNPKHCHSTNQLVLDVKLGGFGGLINSWIKPFMLAQSEGKQFWTPGLGYYMDKKKRCELGTMACFFNRWSECEVVSYDNDEDTIGCSRSMKESKKNTQNSCIRHMSLKSKTDRALLDEYSLLLQGHDGNGYPRTIPEAFRERGHFWYYNQLLWYLLRPNNDLKESLKDAKEKIGWRNENDNDEPSQSGLTLSLHVRHGDSCPTSESIRKKRTCEDLDVYMERAVLPLTAKYGIKTIYLATDDEQVIQDTEKYNQFKWLYQPLEPKDRSPIEWDYINKNNEVDAYHAALQTLIDIFLLAEGDVFVGKFTSNIDRISYSLMANRIGGLAPYVSLDSTWCFDWGQKAGNSTLGPFNC